MQKKEWSLYSPGSLLQAGINQDGGLFLTDGECGYNLSDTPENRKKIKLDFARLIDFRKKYAEK